MARPATQPAAPSAGTLTLTLEEPASSSSSSRQAQQQQQQSNPPQTLVLRLKRAKKKVTWKEGTVDNEFLQRRSSKKCCIFHKHKSFDEDASSDEEDAGDRKPDGGDRPGDGAGPSGCCSHGAAHQH